MLVFLLQQKYANYTVKVFAVKIKHILLQVKKGVKKLKFQLYANI